MLFPLIEKEVRKLFNAKIIVTFKFSKRVSNMVPVIKKYGELVYVWTSETLTKFH